MVKKWLWISVLHFLFAALMGVLLRLYSTGVDSGLVYGHLLHAHSHTAMMGWVYLALTALMYDQFIKKPGYEKLFGITIGAVWGLMISFAVQGYGAFSILFCSVHLLCSYWFVIKTLKETGKASSQSLSLLKISLYLLVISTLGIWAIGPAIALAGKGSDFFSAAIQFYLHFQFNGFFYFGVLALLFKTLGLRVNPGEFRSFLIFSLLSVGLTFSLPVSWYFPAGHWHLVQVSGAVLQAYVTLRLLLSLRHQLKLKILSAPERILLVFSLFSLFLKTVSPLLLIYPGLMNLSHEIRSIAIAYIHLLMLGMITGFLVFFLVHRAVLNAHSIALKWGIGLFITGFLSTEAILFFQGAQALFNFPAWKHAYTALAGFSILLPLAAGCWLRSFTRAASTLHSRGEVFKNDRPL